MINKSILRKEFLAKRNSLTLNERTIKSEIICQKVSSHPAVLVIIGFGGRHEDQRDPDKANIVVCRPPSPVSIDLSRTGARTLEAVKRWAGARPIPKGFFHIGYTARWVIPSLDEKKRITQSVMRFFSYRFGVNQRKDRGKTA